MYDPPDPEGYFEKVVWPMYEKNKQDLENQTDIGECLYFYYKMIQDKN